MIGLYVIILIILFILNTVLLLFNDKYWEWNEKEADATWYGDFGFEWIRLIRGTSDEDSNFLVAGVSLILYILTAGALSAIGALAIYFLYPIILFVVVSGYAVHKISNKNKP